MVGRACKRARNLASREYAHSAHMPTAGVPMLQFCRTYSTSFKPTTRSINMCSDDDKQNKEVQKRNPESGNAGSIQ